MDCIGINLASILSHLSNWRFRAMGLRSKLIELENGSSIHCWVPDGSRHSHKPSLLLIHGFGGDGTLSWWNQIPYLIKDYALYIPDLLFFGESYTKSKERSEIFQAKCLLQLLELEGVKEVTVMGTSYGGFVTFHMAHLAPHLVKKVVIASSGICIDQSFKAQFLLETKCSDISDVLLPCDKARVKQSINNSLYQPLSYIPDFLLTELQQRFNINRKEKIELLRGTWIGSIDCPPLPALDQDALIIWGHGDRIFPVEQAYKLYKHLGSKAKLVVIPKTGHVPQLEKPKIFNNHVLEFLKFPA